MPALLGIILFACCPPVSTYMVYGRGVIFEIFFAIGAFFSLLRWLDAENINHYSVLFILSGILGNYAMPTHIYCWCCLILFALLSGRLDKTGFLKFIRMNFWILGGTFLCYLPVLLGSGFSFLTSILSAAGNPLFDLVQAAGILRDPFFLYYRILYRPADYFFDLPPDFFSKKENSRPFSGHPVLFNSLSVPFHHLSGSKDSHSGKSAGFRRLGPSADSCPADGYLWKVSSIKKYNTLFCWFPGLQLS